MNFKNNGKDNKIKSPKTEKIKSERHYTYEPTNGNKEEKLAQKPKKKDR